MSTSTLTSTPFPVTDPSTGRKYSIISTTLLHDVRDAPDSRMQYGSKVWRTAEGFPVRPGDTAFEIQDGDRTIYTTPPAFQ
jgi:hypothetical protein